jgi:CheY-like chemotaxis protein
MAKGFASQSGGGLHIRSAPGQGTTVTLWLPEADAASLTTLEPLAPGGSVPAAAARVLLVDDEVLVREVLAEQLEDAGFTVLAAADGNAALGVLDRSETVDILVTDFSMPGMDGLAVIRAAQTRLPQLPAVLLTGYSGDGVALAVESAVAGKISLLRKPIRAADLVDRIQVLLAARESAAS